MHGRDDRRGGSEAAGRMERPVRLAIVGGGAAGMFAAVAAARLRVGCVVVERKARLGSKVLMTANGRCNFTKDVPPERFLRDLGFPGAGGAAAEAQARFLAKAVRECPPRRIASTLRSLGVRARTMPDWRMFPADGRAATVVHAFGDAMREAQVPILSNCPVSAIRRRPDGTFLVETAAFALPAENVLVATGGASHPKLGSVGDGQEFARSFGHRIVPFRPGLIGFETSDPRVAGRAGARFENAFARIVSPDGEELYAARGEVDCERFGLSGAAVYNCERFAAKTGLSDFALEAEFGGERVRIENPRPRPLKEAIVTIGGVALEGVDPGTMESRTVPGLYFAGEVLDVDGPTGGYNLSIAFATAALAVESVARAGGGRRGR